MASPKSELLGLLGLARRAGAVVSGTEAVRRAIREGEARLVLTAGDASGVQLDKIRSTMRDRPIPRAVLGDRSALGAAVGRAPLSAVAVTHPSLAARLLEGLTEEAAAAAAMEEQGRACRSSS